MVQTAARCALAIFALWALGSVFEPHHDANRLAVASDALEHSVMAFGLVVLGAAAFTRASLLVVAGGVLLLGAGLEVLQHLALVGGQGDLGDAMANLVGVAIATFAVSAGEARADEGAASK